MKATTQTTSGFYTKDEHKNNKRISIKFLENYNGKLYGKFFTSIRKNDSGIIEGNIYEIILKDKPVKRVKCILVNKVKFHEVPQFTISLDTGLSYGDALILFKSFGYDVSNFDLEIDYCIFETEHVYK
jgi:hypothetical protein